MELELQFVRRWCASFDRESILRLFLYIVWAVTLLAYLRGVVNHLPGLSEYTDEIEISVIVLPLLLSVPALINKFCLADYLFYLLLAVYYLSCYVFFPQNADYLDENAFKCICCVYTYYFVGRLFDIEKMYNMLVILSAVCIYMNFFYYFKYSPESKVAGVDAYDNMFAAYNLLPHLLMMLWTTLEKFRIWKAATFVLGIFILLSFGTRGPFVCLAFFGIIYFFFFMRFEGAIYVKAGIIATFLIVLANLNNIIFYLVKTFTGLQLSTRILEKLIAGDLGNDSYRGVLRDMLYRVLDNGEHFWGLGLFGSQNYGVIYPHFLPLDFFCTYGYFVGSILLILLFAFIVRSLWITRGKKVQAFIMLLFSLSIIKLMLTGTFVNEPYFYFLIGVCATENLSYIYRQTNTSDEIGE